MSENKSYKVVVIGAGAAGLAAASLLSQNGVTNICILEAQERIGGRIHTIFHGDQPLEMGAQWIHGEDGNCVYQLAKKEGLIDKGTITTNKDIFNTLYIKEDGTKLPSELVEDILNTFSGLENVEEFKGSKLSLGEYYLEKFAKINKWGDLGYEMLDWFSKYNDSMNGTDSWFDCSAHNDFVYQECPGNIFTNWKNGYCQLLEHFKKSITNEAIQLNSPVKKVIWKDSSNLETKVKVELEGENIIYAEHVIVTVSLAVLKETATQLFHPPLPPKKMAAIKGLGIDVVDKIYLEFPYKFWNDDCLGFAPLFSKKESSNIHWTDSIFGFYIVDKLPCMLTVWVTGKAARIMESLPLEEVKSTCEKFLRDRLTNDCEVPDAIWCSRSQWSSNPWIRGAYSYRSVSSELMDVHASDLAFPIINNSKSPILCFAGEGTHSSYYSTVHGAVETGFREAQRILDYLRSV